MKLYKLLSIELHQLSDFSWMLWPSLSANKDISLVVASYQYFFFDEMHLFSYSFKNKNIDTYFTVCVYIYTSLLD